MGEPLRGLNDRIVREEFGGFNPIGIALSELRPGSQYVLRGYSYADIEWSDKNAEDLPDRDSLERKIDEVMLRRRAWNSYGPQRQSAYPSVQEQLDMLFWDQVNGTSSWKDTIQAIKNMYPKPATS